VTVSEDFVVVTTVTIAVSIQTSWDETSTSLFVSALPYY
jgi:hypothetical protein